MKILLIIAMFALLTLLNIYDPDHNYDLEGMKNTPVGDANGHL
jgi:hypothetical protein